MTEEQVPKLPYVVDTNIFMDWQARHYPTGVFVSLLSKIDSLIAAHRFIAPDLVQEEIDAVGTNELIAWAKERPQLWVPRETVFGETMTIQGQFPGLLDPKAEFEEADAYVIGLAQQKEGIVVTSETPAAEKRKPKREFFIPDVCRELGIPCINFLGMIRREKWTF
jgi:hypothetical protein